MSQHRSPRRAWAVTGLGALRLALAGRLKVALASLVALVTVVVAAGMATAFWTSAGSDTATGTVGSLNAPTNVAGVQTPGTGTVQVSWTAPTGTPSADGYYVLRIPSSGPAVPACGTSAASPTTNLSCADTSVPVGTYTYVVVATHESWTATSAPSAAVSVAQTAQMITFTSSPVAPTFGGTYTVTATGGASGNPVVFSSDTPAVCSVSAGGSVTFDHAGTCTINANQAGTAYYSAAPQSQQSFEVAKAAQTITFTSTAPTAAVVDGPGYTPTATGGGSGNPVVFTVATPGVCTLAAGVVTHQHVGTCTINANQAGDADHLPANQAQQSYTVGQGSQSITFTSTAPTDAKVTDTYTVTATGGNSGNAVVFSSGSGTVCSVTSGGSVTFLTAGTCLVRADQAGNADYLAAAQVTQSINVTKRDQTITFTSTPSSPTFNGSTYTVTATASSGLPVSFTASGACTISGSTVTFTAAGTCTIDATQGGNAEYNAAPLVQQSFTVAKANQTITFAQPTTPVSSGTSATLVATASSGLTVTFTTPSAASICTVSGTTVTYAGAGTCVINANQAGNTNYNAAAQVQRSVVVQAVGFAITGRTSGPPQNSTTITGTGTPGATVTVYLCTGNVASCTASGPNLKDSETATVLANGTWSVFFDKPGNGSATYTAHAYQTTPAANARLVFTTT